ncbi:hypothetical protein P154DRAFT_597274 [Amniculicola lignicola CBS 123094]|uniref:Uncharacterized protein n=1 Tax=Amniculicola lignicola CBS 123094 TaxID=1392246 RepID=A0A6A5WYJ0_9PLEO|nr:hypothetical protein P154DRAFT_597274 [Amniculicola lignicola CBS 123094]
MCSSAPRFEMYEKMGPHTDISIFWPELQYKDDNTDADLEKVKNNAGMPIPKAKRDGLVEEDMITEELVPEEDLIVSRREANKSTIVKSARAQHSARVLCEAKSSWGDDFVSWAEGEYRDMEAKEVWPLCTDDIAYGCYDDDTDKMRIAPHGRRILNGRAIPDKTYDQVVKWGTK